MIVLHITPWRGQMTGHPLNNSIYNPNIALNDGNDESVCLRIKPDVRYVTDKWCSQDYHYVCELDCANMFVSKSILTIFHRNLYQRHVLLFQTLAFHVPTLTQCPQLMILTLMANTTEFMKPL